VRQGKRFGGEGKAPTGTWCL